MNKQELMSFSRGMRRDIVELVHRAGSEGAHLGGCLSLVEILTVLYTQILRFDPDNPAWNQRDRVIMSKAHASIAQYAAMHQAGLLTDTDMQQPLYGPDTFLYKHARRNIAHGLEMSGGSLGQGLPYAVGMAVALQRQDNNGARVYAIVGDGECNEGSIWEAAALAGHLCLSNLIVIVDKNHLQLDGCTKNIVNMENICQRWQAFGFDAYDINGHDYVQLQQVFQKTTNKPLAVVADTVKGNGVSFAEGNWAWHNNHLTDELYQKALKEI